MLQVQVNNNRNIQVSFDVTGKGEDVICYYIREVKIKLKKYYWRNRQDQVHQLIDSLNETPYCNSSYTESFSELVLTLQLKKLFGFLSLAYFETAIEYQFNEIMETLKKENVKENDPYQMEMVLDVIY